MLWTIFSGGIIGVLLGFVLQRTRFCMTGGFRDMYIARNNRLFYAFLIAIAIQSVGVLAAIELDYLSYEYEDYSIIGVLIGSFIFGIGIVLASGCATGTWYRAGEGLIGSWVALFAYALSAAAMKFGALNGLQKAITQHARVNENLSATLGVSVWWLVALLVAVTAYFAYKTLAKPQRQAVGLPPKFTGIRHYLFEKRYHPFQAAVAVGVIAFLAWFASASTGRNDGLGITTPSANIIHFLVTGNEAKLNWGVFLVLGIFVGSFLAAKGSNEFRWRLPDSKTLAFSLVGGLLMGVGASLAGGCTIGNGLTATAVMSSKGWLSLAVTILGVWTMSYFLFVKPSRQATACTA